MKTNQVIRVHQKFETLDTIGIAAEYFPDYVNTQTTPHAVDVVLFSCVFRGKGQHLMGDEAYDIGPGSVGLTHYGQLHDVVTDPKGVAMFNLYLDLQRHPLPTLPAPLQATLAAILAPHPGLVHRLNRRLHLVFSDVNRMAEPLWWIVREQEQQAAGYEAVIRQSLLNFLILLCRVAVEDGYQRLLQPDRSVPGWLESVRQLLETRYEEPLTLDDLASHAGVSPEHLCRRFKRYTGRPPLAYLGARRVQAAMWRLRTTTDPVLEVALASGFSDLSHFNRTFKSAAGMTPTAYRRGPD